MNRLGPSVSSPRRTLVGPSAPSAPSAPSIPPRTAPRTPSSERALVPIGSGAPRAMTKVPETSATSATVGVQALLARGASAPVEARSRAPDDAAVHALFAKLLASQSRGVSRVDGSAIDAALGERLDDFAEAYAQSALRTPEEVVRFAQLVLSAAPPSLALCHAAREITYTAEVSPGAFSADAFNLLMAAADASTSFARVAVRGLPRDQALVVGEHALHAAPPEQVPDVALALLDRGPELCEASPGLRAKLLSELRDMPALAAGTAMVVLCDVHPVHAYIDVEWLRGVLEEHPAAMDVLCDLFAGTSEGLVRALARVEDDPVAALPRVMPEATPFRRNLVEALLRDGSPHAGSLFRALNDPAAVPAFVAAVPPGAAGRDALVQLGVSPLAFDVIRAYAEQAPRTDETHDLRSYLGMLLPFPSSRLAIGLLCVSELAHAAGVAVTVPATPPHAPASLPSASGLSALETVLPRMHELREARELAAEVMRGLPREAILNCNTSLDGPLSGVEQLAPRPDLQLLATSALVDAYLTAADLGSVDSAERMADVAQAIDDWRATQPAPATSKRARMREAAVGAASMPFALLDSVLSVGGTRALDLAPALFALIGDRDTAVNADRRRPMLLALASLATLGLRAVRSSEARADLRAVLATAEGETDVVAFTARCRALVDDLERRFPPPDAHVARALARATSGLGDAPGASGVLRAIGRWASVFTEGVDAAALERLLRAVETGTLDDVRKRSLVASRFPVDDVASLPAIFEKLHAGASERAADLLGKPSAHGLARVVDEGGAHAWARAVDDVQSCQSTDRSAARSKGLLNRFEDGSVRLLAVRDDAGTCVARAAMRLVTLKQPARVALLVDSHYLAPATPALAAEASTLLAALARRRGHALGVPVVFADPRARPEGGMPLDTTITLPMMPAADYVDLGDTGIVPAGTTLQPIAASVVVVEPSAALRGSRDP